MTDPVQELLDHYRANDPRAPVTRAGGRSTSAALADPLTNDLMTVTLALSLPGPPSNLWEGTHLQGKIEIDADVDLRLLHSPAGPDVTIGESMGFESLLAQAMEVNLEFDLDEIDLREACERGNLAEFGGRILEGIGLSRQWGLCHGLDPKYGASWDQHYCLIDALIEGSDIRFELPIAGTATQVEVRIPKGVTLKLGPTPRGWATLKRRFGGSVTRHIAGAMARIAASGGEMSAAGEVTASEAETSLMAGSGMAFASFAGLIASPAEMAMMSRNLPAELARDAKRAGVEPGAEQSYAHGYVSMVYYGRATEPAAVSTGAVARAARKASSDVEQFGQPAVRDALQKRFNGGRPLALRPDGIPASESQIGHISNELASAIAKLLQRQ
ncbi:MAG TPA: hypothetical protein PKJ41_02255 [Bryobacteraceae bacterium]|nr:hypothetical protein [Bryobacteraceae bacterium]